MAALLIIRPPVDGHQHAEDEANLGTTTALILVMLLRTSDTCVKMNILGLMI